MTLPELPPWVVLHVPHDSITIPVDVRNQFLLDDTALIDELRLMTDRYTLELFATNAGEATVVRAPVSRLVVDVERFIDDTDEPMAARGMGVIYTRTSQLAPLRQEPDAMQRKDLLERYYRPHHARLEAAALRALDVFGRCLVIDCHSFPIVALPYEQADSDAERPEICIGTDSFHTSTTLATGFFNSFRNAGWQVSLNDPFGGALVPASFYRRDARIQAVMVEVNRRLYMNEAEATKKPDFDQTASRVSLCCRQAISQTFR